MLCFNLLRKWPSELENSAIHVPPHYTSLTSKLPRRKTIKNKGRLFYLADFFEVSSIICKFFTFISDFWFRLLAWRMKRAKVRRVRKKSMTKKTHCGLSINTSGITSPPRTTCSSATHFCSYPPGENSLTITSPSENPSPSMKYAKNSKPANTRGEVIFWYRNISINNIFALLRKAWNKSQRQKLLWHWHENGLVNLGWFQRLPTPTSKSQVGVPLLCFVFTALRSMMSAEVIEQRSNMTKVCTTLQSMINAKLSKQRFWHCHENGLIKTIQMIPHNL